MSNKSMQDFAFETLKKKRKAVPFATLWEEVATEIGLVDEAAKAKIVKFYNALSLDARFYQLDGNVWDLSQRHSFEKIRSDKSRYADLEDDTDVEDEDAEDEIIDNEEDDDEQAKDDDDDDEDEA